MRQPLRFPAQIQPSFAGFRGVFADIDPSDSQKSREHRAHDAQRHVFRGRAALKSAVPSPTVVDQEIRKSRQLISISCEALHTDSFPGFGQPAKFALDRLKLVSAGPLPLRQGPSREKMKWRAYQDRTQPRLSPTDLCS